MGSTGRRVASSGVYGSRTLLVVCLALGLSLMTAGSARAAEYSSNGWYGFIRTESTLVRDQPSDRLTQTDLAVAVFRGDEPIRMNGVFTYLWQSKSEPVCGSSGLYNETWEARVSPTTDLTSAPSVVSMPSGGVPQPGVATAYRIRQGSANGPYEGTLTSFQPNPIVCGIVWKTEPVSGTGAVGIIDKFNPLPNLSAPAGWTFLEGTQTVVSTDGGFTNRSTTWTWSLTRTPPAKIIVEKQTIPDGAAAQFDFTGLLSGTIGDGGSLSLEVDPGTYSVSELAEAGWLVDSIVCQDPSSDSSGTGSTATFNVGVGETVKCVFTNRAVAAGCDTGGGQRTLLTPTYSARIPLAFLPDANLFTFSPLARYCWDGTKAVVEVVTVFGDADSGLDEAALSALGFETRWDSNESSAEMDANTAHIVADFEFAFNWLIFIDKFGIKSKAEKYVAKKTAKSLENVLKKYGYGSALQTALAEELVLLQNDVANEISKVLQNLKKPLPDSLAKEIETGILEEFNDQFDAIRTQILGIIGTSNYTPKLMSEIIINEVIAGLNEFTTWNFSVWTPEWILTAYPDGTSSSSVGGDVHPLLLITKTA